MKRNGGFPEMVKPHWSGQLRNFGTEKRTDGNINVELLSTQSIEIADYHTTIQDGSNPSPCRPSCSASPAPSYSCSYRIVRIHASPHSAASGAAHHSPVPGDWYPRAASSASWIYWYASIYHFDILAENLSRC